MHSPEAGGSTRNQPCRHIEKNREPDHGICDVQKDISQLARGGVPIELTSPWVVPYVWSVIELAHEGLREAGPLVIVIESDFVECVTRQQPTHENN
jgi:hypothetical protein